MKTKQRSPGQTALSISMETQLKVEIKKRARALRLKVSQYLAMLAQQDIDCGGDLVLRDASSNKAFGVGVVSNALDAFAATPPTAPTHYGSKPKVARRSKARPAGGLSQKGEA